MGLLTSRNDQRTIIAIKAGYLAQIKSYPATPLDAATDDPKQRGKAPE
jgi:hypothetical protein